MLVTGFPSQSPWKITEDNWEALFIRLQIMEAMQGCQRRYNNGDRKAREMFFTHAELKSMIGLAMKAGNKSDAEYKESCWQYLNKEARGKLHPSEHDNPYYWETLFAPK